MNPGPRILPLVLSLALCPRAYGSAPPARRLEPAQVRAITEDSERKLRSILARELYLPGLAVALVSREELLWVKGFGYRDRARTLPVDGDTIFGVLSVSKPVTVTGAAERMAPPRRERSGLPAVRAPAGPLLHAGRRGGRLPRRTRHVQEHQAVQGARRAPPGGFKPATPLAAFQGSAGDGTWTLNVRDLVSIDTGGVRAVTLNLSG